MWYISLNSVKSFVSDLFAFDWLLSILNYDLATHLDYLFKGWPFLVQLIHFTVKKLDINIDFLDFKQVFSILVFIFLSQHLFHILKIFDLFISVLFDLGIIKDICFLLFFQASC